MLIETLRGPAFKSGCTVVSGFTDELLVISTRARAVMLFEKSFVRTPMLEGPVTFKKAPKLPDNVAVIAETQHPIKTGLLVGFHDVGLEPSNIDFVPGARIVGKLDVIRDFLKGRKFFVLSRWKDFICLELA